MTTPRDGLPHLRAVLAAHPGARMNAVGPDGVFVPLPPVLATLGHPELPGRSGVETVDPADHLGLLGAWEACLRDGRSEVEVREHLPSGSVRSRLHFVDLRDTLGVVAAVGHPAGAAADDGAPATEPERPRVGHLRKDLTGVVVALGAGTARMLGHPAEALLGSRSLELLHPDDRQSAAEHWSRTLSSPGPGGRVRLRHRTADGAWRWYDVTHDNRLEDALVGCVVSELVDVTEEVRAREEAAAGERLLHRLAEAVPVGLLQLTPAGEVQYVNERLREVLGILGPGPLRPQLDGLAPEQRSRLLGAVAGCLRDGADVALQVEARVQGRRLLAEVALRALRSDAPGAPVEGVIACVTDVTEPARLRAELEHRATSDALTGCLNRSSLVQRLASALQRVHPGEGCAVLFLDLDGFKAVNDKLGHAAGDDALRRLAGALRAAARAGDAVGRLGGDEFVLVCPGVASAAQARALATALDGRLRASTVPLLPASTGVAWTDDPQVQPDVLLGRADTAMYAAKRSRAGTPVLWREGARPHPARRG